MGTARTLSVAQLNNINREIDRLRKIASSTAATNLEEETYGPLPDDIQERILILRGNAKYDEARALRDSERLKQKAAAIRAAQAREAVSPRSLPHIEAQGRHLPILSGPPHIRSLEPYNPRSIGSVRATSAKVLHKGGKGKTRKVRS